MPWKDFGGVQVLLQGEGYSCGMACVAMVIHIVQGGQPSEGAIKAMSKSTGGGGGYKAALADRGFVGGLRMLTATAAPAQDVSAGTQMQNLSQVLTSVKITNAYGQHVDFAQGIASGGTKPMILHLAWGQRGDGGGHFVVAEVVNGKLRVRDPASGLTTGTIKREYTDSNASVGVFSGWIISAT